MEKEIIKYINDALKPRYSSEEIGNAFKVMLERIHAEDEKRKQFNEKAKEFVEM